MEDWAKKFSKKINSKHVQNTFGHFWERFRAFLQFLKSFDFFEIFRRLDLPGSTGQKNFFDKIAPKHVQNTFGPFFGNDFWAFLEFWKVFWFFWKFSTTRTSKEHWAKKLFRKNRPKTYSKHVWTLLGTIVDIFGILKVFLICLKIFEDSTFHRTLGKKTFEKITPKYVQNTFGQLWERFWVCLEFWKIFDFFENFRRLDPPWNTGQNFFRKKYPKTCSKHVWTFLGTILGFSAILKTFRFFLKIFEDSTLHGTLGKNFSKKIPQNMFKTRLDIFGNDFRLFCNFEKFSIFLKIFEDSTLHGTLGKNFSK